MSLTKFLKDIRYHQKNADRPTMDSAELKRLFDQAGLDIKEYINDVLTVELDNKFISSRHTGSVEKHLGAVEFLEYGKVITIKLDLNFMSTVDYGIVHSGETIAHIPYQYGPFGSFQTVCPLYKGTYPNLTFSNCIITVYENGNIIINTLDNTDLPSDVVLQTDITYTKY